MIKWGMRTWDCALRLGASSPHGTVIVLPSVSVCTRIHVTQMALRMRLLRGSFHDMFAESKLTLVLCRPGFQR